MNGMGSVELLKRGATPRNVLALRQEKFQSYF